MPRLVSEAEQRPKRGLARRLATAAIVLTGLAIFGLWRIDNPRVETLRMVAADALLPSMSAVSGPVEFLGEMTSDVETFLDVYNQNERLRREIQRLKGWRAAAQALEEENAQLRALNRVRLRPRLTFVTGDVITDAGGPFSASAIVNVGRRDGVLDGSAAVDGEGLAGRVVGVGERAARLLLLTDYSSRVPVVIQPSGKRAVLAGDGTALPPLEFLADMDGVHPGDMIETSGDGGVFPPDLPVGRVVATRNAGLRARLAADYGRLEFVRVLRYRPDVEIDQVGDLITRPGASLPPATHPAEAAAPTEG